MSVVAFPAESRKALRQALLGAAAAASLGGAVVALPVGAAPAVAAESAGPDSFADIVDRVKGAVVSVKVKLADGAEEEPEVDGRPFPRGGPFDRFFRPIMVEPHQPQPPAAKLLDVLQVPTTVTTRTDHEHTRFFHDRMPFSHRSQVGA